MTAGRGSEQRQDQAAPPTPPPLCRPCEGHPWAALSPQGTRPPSERLRVPAASQSRPGPWKTGLEKNPSPSPKPGQPPRREVSFCSWGHSVEGVTSCSCWQVQGLGPGEVAREGAGRAPPHHLGREGLLPITSGPPGASDASSLGRSSSRLRRGHMEQGGARPLVPTYEGREQWQTHSHLYTVHTHARTRTGTHAHTHRLVCTHTYVHTHAHSRSRSHAAEAT